MQDRSRLQLGAQASGANARLEREQQRLLRALTFAQELATALRRDFAPLWAGAAADLREARLVAAVAAIEAEGARGRAFLAAQAQVGAPEALAALQTYDLNPLLAATQGLQGLADALRQRTAVEPGYVPKATGPMPQTQVSPAGVQAQVPPNARPAAPNEPAAQLGDAPAPRAPNTGPLQPLRGSGPLPQLQQGRAAIRGIAAPLTVRALPRPVVAAPPRDDHWGGAGHAPIGAPKRHAGPHPSSIAPAGPAKPPLSGAAQGREPQAPRPLPPAATSKPPARQQFDAAYQLAREILAYVGGRLALVQVSLAATGLPGPRVPWHHVAPALEPGADKAGIDAPLRPWLPLLAQVFYANAAAAREGVTALEQWRQCQDLARDAEALRARLGGLPPEVQGQVLAGFEVGKLRASAHPLGHLHVRFKPFPHLSAIFPGPATTARP